MAETTTIARPYARAAFEAAQSEQDGLTKWSDMLSMAATIAQNDDMHTVLSSPDHDESFKAGLLLDLAGDALSQPGSNFIKLLAENQRLDILPEIHEVYEQMRADAEKTVEAEVISAFEISDQQQQQIAQSLQQRLDREVTLNCTIDESLLGGAIIRAGDLVIDGSARGKLTQLRQTLKH